VDTVYCQTDGGACKADVGVSSGAASMLLSLDSTMHGVGSFKIYVYFAEYSLFCRALLQKKPMLLGSLLIVATSWRLV